METVASDTVVMPFGKHKGKTLTEIAAVNLLYLDWLNGIDLTRRPRLMVAVAEICLSHAREIERLIDEREERFGG